LKRGFFYKLKSEKLLSLSKKSKIAFFALKKQLENGYSTLANLGSFS